MTVERPGCALCRIGVPGATLRVTGPERATWLNGLLTCDARTCTTERAVWGLALNRTGKIQSVCWLVATADALLVGVPASTSASILEQFDRMLVMEDAEIEDASSEYEWSLAIGSECGTVSGAIAAGRLELFGLDEQALVFGAGTAPQLEAPELDEVAWTRLRLERGLPQFGVDFDDDDRPHEAALDRRAVDWKKGCYLGQEVVCMQDMRGKVSRSVFRLGFGADPAANIPVGTAVLDSSGTQLGVLSSVAYSERAERWLAMSQLPSAKTSEPLFVGAESGQLRAELVTDQF